MSKDSLRLMVVLCGAVIAGLLARVLRKRGIANWYFANVVLVHFPGGQGMDAEDLKETP